jgi:hypothetical protein
MSNDYDPRQAFLDELDRFIERTRTAQRFRGQTQAVAALQRIRTLSVFGGSPVGRGGRRF